MNLTANERTLLASIIGSEYQSGSSRDSVVGHPVWTAYLNTFTPRNVFPGVVASLSRKGLASTHIGTTPVQYPNGYAGIDPSTIAITRAGWDAFHALQFCPLCGDDKPLQSSCGCFDNHGQ